jgi:hypothetical protein
MNKAFIYLSFILLIPVTAYKNKANSVKSTLKHVFIALQPSPDNTENFIVYHSRKHVRHGWTREIRIQKFT